MPLDYDGASAGLFTRAGKLIKYINNYRTLAATTMPAELKAIADLFEAADLTLQISGLYGTYESFKSTASGFRLALASFVDAVFTDRDTVLEILQIPNPDVNSVLPRLFQAMVDDGETVDRSAVTLGGPTPPAANVGNGTVLVTKILDGFNPPLQRGQAVQLYDGLSSELTVPSETMRLECTQDSQKDGLPEGSERFSWVGGVPDQVLGWQDEGSGEGPNLTVAGSSGILSDPGLENWGGSGNNTPANWTLVGSTAAGTHLFREATTFYRGTYGAKFSGTGALATMGIQQAIAAGAMNNRRRYLASARIRQADTGPSAGQFEMHFSGTGYVKTAPVNQVQRIAVSGASGGTYTVSFRGATSAAINATDNAATVQSKLRAVRGLEMAVNSQSGSSPNFTNDITMHGHQGNQELMTADGTSLTGGGVVTVTQQTSGTEGDCVVIPFGAMPSGAWALVYFWINTPDIIPSNWTLVAQIASTFTSGSTLYLDDIVLEPATYHGGVGAVLVPGSTRFLSGDRIAFSVANDQAGVFQDFFRQKYAFQLPSSGSPSIADALAT